MEKKSKKENQIIIWLRKIFSLQFLSVIIAVVGLWFAYATFIKDKPGELQFMTNSGKLDKDITTVFYGFELTSDSVNVMALPDIPILANVTTNTIEDITVYATTPDNFDFLGNGAYIIARDDSQKFGVGTVVYKFKLDKINPIDGVYWPVSIVYANKNECFDYPIELHYSFKTQDMKTILLHLIGIPNSEKKLSENVIEKDFIRKVYPYLLKVQDLNETAICYKNKIVQKPSKEKITSSNGIANSIMDLK